MLHALGIDFLQVTLPVSLWLLAVPGKVGIVLAFIVGFVIGSELYLWWS